MEDNLSLTISMQQSTSSYFLQKIVKSLRIVKYFVHTWNNENAWEWVQTKLVFGLVVLEITGGFSLNVFIPLKHLVKLKELAYIPHIV